MVLIPFEGIWDNPAAVAIVVAVAAALFVVTVAIHRTRALTAVALVLLAWQSVMAIDQDQLPQAFRGLSPQSISDLSSSSRLLILRAGVLALPFAMTLILTFAIPSARQRFREYFRFGNWCAGISWPLPWWGVPAMPFWMLFALTLPGSIPAFLPFIDWAMTAQRWGTFSYAMIVMIPLLALLNAFMEETVFRFGLMALLSDHLSVPAATIPAAVIFGFVHFHGGYPNGLLGAMLLSLGGFFLGYFVVVQKGISGAVLWHMIMDVVILSCVFK